VGTETGLDCVPTGASVISGLSVSLSAFVGVVVAASNTGAAVVASIVGRSVGLTVQVGGSVSTFSDGRLDGVVVGASTGGNVVGSLVGIFDGGVVHDGSIVSTVATVGLIEPNLYVLSAALYWLPT